MPNCVCGHPLDRHEPAGHEAALRSLPPSPEGELWGQCRDCGCMGLISNEPVFARKRRNWIAPVAADLKEPLPERDAAIMRASGPVGFQWTEGSEPRPSIALDDLGGPAETMEAAGLTNRGSLDWAMKHRGFPSPVKVLQRVRIWDLREVKAWKDAQDV